MRILAIRIKNLASLEGKIEIDFTAPPLASAGIFAITGPTGAGKSTLLDAICLALYAETPRYIRAENSIDITDVKNSTIKQGDPRGILRDGTSDGYAEVDFVAVDGNTYCAAWSVKRAHNRIDGNLQNYEMRLKNISTNQDIPGKKTEILEEIKRLVGLSFEQFTRSVLLAQGDFTAFLKAGKDEKSSLLEKLTGTHIYSEISKRIFDNHRQHQQDLKDLNAQREGIHTLTTEELHQLEEEKTALDTAIKENSTLISNLKKEITWHEELLKLQDGVNHARQQSEEKKSAKAASVLRENQLKLVTAVQPAAPLLRELKSVREQKELKVKQSEQLQSSLSELNQEKEKLDHIITQASQSLLTATQKEQDAIPALNAARALDVKLTEKNKQVTQATAEADNTRIKLEQHQLEVANTQKEATAAEQQLIQLNDWKAKNESRRQVAEQDYLIISKLQDAEETLASQKHYKKRIENSAAEIANLTTEKNKLLEKRGNCLEQLQRSQEDFNSLSISLADIDTADIESRQNSVTARIQDIIAGSAQWQILQNITAEAGTLQQSLLKSKAELEQFTNELTITNSLLEVKRTEKETLSRSLEQTRLIAAASVEELRATLEPGQPCPVCGSTTHPYTTEHPVLEKVLLELDNHFRQSEKEYLQLLTAQSGLDNTCSHIKRNIAILEANISAKSRQVETMHSQWQSLTIYRELSSIAEEEVSTWLQEQLQDQRNKQQLYQTKLREYHQNKTLLESYRERLANQQHEFNNIENDIKDVNRNLQSFLEQKSLEIDEEKKAGNNLLNLRQTLSEYFPTEQWFTEWQANPQVFVKRITDFATTWKNNISKAEEYSRQQTVFTVKLKAMQERTDSMQEELSLKHRALATLQQECRQITTERKSLFNGHSTEDVEAAFRNDITRARQALEERNKEQQALQTKITRHTTTSEQLTRDIQTLSGNECGLKEKLTGWIGNYNRTENASLTETELETLLAYTQEWMEKERSFLRSLDDALIQAQTVLHERETKLGAHTELHLSQRTLEEVINLEKETQNAWNENSKQSHLIVFRLNEDNSNKKKIGKLLDRITQQATVVENWARLNEIIGSADGKKFRQIAQEYTLDLLLTYANVHLELLSKRYILQRIPNSLGLQVLDQDMGDEVRTVYSLSGGESFLVSLALALALASLSSSRMKVESLFIDEGFGSLDPTTLNIAMDALERLHNQGRKVGVISHVQEMTDRIPVQIKVSKQQSGKSKVEII